MNEKKDSSILVEIINQLNDATKNLRYQILVLGIASIMAFCGAWNSIKYGWFQSRINVFQNELLWYDDLRSGIPPSNLTETQKAHFKKCLEIYNETKPTKETLECELANYQQAKTNNIVLVKIPFLGICFDINDLGLLSGIGFVLLYYLIFYAMLQRHFLISSALAIISKIKDDSEKERAYLALVTNQILAVDKPNIRGYSILRLTPRLFYIVPIIVYFGIIVHDLLTLDVALTNWQSPFKGYFSIAVGFIFLSVITFMASLILGRVNKTIQLWKNNIPPNIIKEITDNNGSHDD